MTGLFRVMFMIQMNINVTAPVLAVCDEQSIDAKL